MNILQPLVSLVRNYAINACEKKAKQIAADCWLSHFEEIADIGGGRSRRWPKAAVVDAAMDPGMDFNTRTIPFADQSFPLVVCEQVIEHLHNTTFFLTELYRILQPGGTLLLSTENLCSLPNMFAMTLQLAPFSTQALCGQFIGGWKNGVAGEGYDMPPNHPAYSGVRGHVRVMTVGQLKHLLRWTGFTNIRKGGYGGKHYVLFQCRKMP